MHFSEGNEGLSETALAHASSGGLYQLHAQRLITPVLQERDAKVSSSFLPPHRGTPPRQLGSPRERDLGGSGVQWLGTLQSELQFS